MDKDWGVCCDGETTMLTSIRQFDVFCFVLLLLIVWQPKEIKLHGLHREFCQIMPILSIIIDFAIRWPVFLLLFTSLLLFCLYVYFIPFFVYLWFLCLFLLDISPPSIYIRLLVWSISQYFFSKFIPFLPFSLRFQTRRNAFFVFPLVRNGICSTR